MQLIGLLRRLRAAAPILSRPPVDSETLKVEAAIG